VYIQTGYDSGWLCGRSLVKPERCAPNTQESIFGWLCGRSQGLQERLAEAEEALESSSRAAREMEDAYQAASKEVAEVKQRARALLEEKDAQLQAAKVSPKPQIPNLFNQSQYTTPLCDCPS
jgi:hypothetical protein